MNILKNKVTTCKNINHTSWLLSSLSHFTFIICTAVARSRILHFNNLRIVSFASADIVSFNSNLPCWINLYNSFYDVALKGNLPYNIKYNKIPKAHISAGSPKYGNLAVISGAMYGGVPQKFLNLSPHLELNPKSISLTCSSPSIRIFSSLISRWQILFSWQCWIPCKICLKITFTFLSAIVLFFLNRPASDNLPPSYIISSSFLLSFTTWNKFTMFSWSSCLRWFISRYMLSNL